MSYCGRRTACTGSNRLISLTRVRHMRKKRAFTLIELLVVVAILAVLIAILLPSLGRAREKAKITRCGANIRSIGQATTTYASEWNDGIPTPFRHDAANAGDQYLPFHSYLTYSSKTGNKIYGLGLLYNASGGILRAPNSTIINVVGAGQIKDPRAFFCPSMPDPGFAFPPNGNSSNEWLYYLGQAQGTDNVRMGYLYAPYAENNGKAFKFPWQKLGKMPKKAFLASDLIMHGNSIAHVGARGTAATWNLLFADGHVDAVVSTYVTTRLVKDKVDFASESKGYQSTAEWVRPTGNFYKMTEDLASKAGN